MQSTFKEIPTLGQVFEDYQRVRRMKSSTVQGYAKRLKYIKPWLDMPVNQIDKRMVSSKHEELTSIGGATANSVFRTV